MSDGGAMTERHEMTADLDVYVAPFVSREGSSLRTQKELDYIFVMDVADIAQLEPNEESRSRADSLVADARVYMADDCECRYDDMAWVAEQAEALLEDMGLWVEWADGYSIYR